MSRPALPGQQGHRTLARLHLPSHPPGRHQTGCGPTAAFRKSFVIAGIYTAVGGTFDWSRALLSAIVLNIASPRFRENNWKKEINEKVYFVVVVQLPSCVRLLVTPWTATCRASLSLTISQSFSKFMSIASVMPSSHLMLWLLFSLFSLCP